MYSKNYQAEGTMDTFIDKLAQKTIANDMISANTAAEARENQKISEQLAVYEDILQEMKQVSLKNIESATKVTEMLDGFEGTGSSQVSAGISAEDMEKLKSSLDGKAEEIVKAGEETASSIKYAAEDAVLSVKLSSEDAVKEVKASVDGVKTSSEEAIKEFKTSADDAVKEFKSVADESVASIKKTSDEAFTEMKTTSDEAVSSIKTAADDAILSAKNATDDAVTAMKIATDEAVASVKGAGETAAESVAKSTEDIKLAAEASAADIKQITESGVEGMKQASAESVESMKQASMEATETIKQVVEEGLEAIKGASDGVVRGGAPEMDKTYLDAQFENVQDTIHSENVKVYRNVQAAVDDSLADQTKALRGYIERTQKDGSKMPMVLGIVNFALNIIILAVLILNAMGVF